MKEDGIFSAFVRFSDSGCWKLVAGIGGWGMEVSTLNAGGRLGMVKWVIPASEDFFDGVCSEVVLSE